MMSRLRLVRFDPPLGGAEMRFVLAAAALVAVFTAVAVPARAHTAAPGPQCGGTLWKLMTLSDTGKTGVGFWNPVKTTLGALQNGAELRPLTRLVITQGCGHF